MNQISIISLLALCFSGLIAIIVPLILMHIFHKRGSKYKFFFAGIITFFVFALILEQLMHFVVFNIFDLFQDKVLSYYIYAGLAAGVFEETGRLIIIKIMSRKHMTKIDSLMLGAGHGGCESILILGITYVLNIVLIFLVQFGVIKDSSIIESISNLWNTPSILFLIAGFERIMAIALHIALSVIVYKAVSEHKYIFFVVAILIHALVDMVTVMLSDMFSVFVAEGVCFLMIAATVIIATKIYKKMEV